jgi:hypothetical protein
MSTLAGQSTCCGLVLNDPVDGAPKLFFVFQDLAVKVVGQYRLLCHIVDISRFFDLIRPYIPVPPLITSPFDIHSLQTFPGVLEPTQLSRSFTLQGLRRFHVGVRPSGRGYTASKQRRTSTTL